MLNRIMDRLGRHARASLLGLLGHTAGLFRGGACHIQQDDDSVGMEFPERRHLLAALQFFQFRGDAR